MKRMDDDFMLQKRVIVVQDQVLVYLLDSLILCI